MHKYFVNTFIYCKSIIFQYLNMIIREFYDNFLLVPSKLSYNRYHIYGSDSQRVYYRTQISVYKATIFTINTDYATIVTI